MTYKHDEMPPVIRRIENNEYRLEGQSGIVFHEFEKSSMSHPRGWWSELVEAMRENYDDPIDAMHDLTLLSASRDWTYINETQEN